MMYLSKEAAKELRKLTKNKNLPPLGFDIEISVADAARAECRYCRTKIKKGEKAIRVSYSDGRYPVGYQIHKDECVIDPRIARQQGLSNG